MQYIPVKSITDVIAMNMGIKYYDIDGNRFYPSISDSNNQMCNYKVESLEYDGGDNFSLYITEHDATEVPIGALTISDFVKIAYNLNDYIFTDINDNSIVDLSRAELKNSLYIVEYIGVMADSKTVIIQTDYELCEDY